LNNQKITLGYKLDKWQNYGLREPIEMNLSRSENTHFLGVGASGSGKSYMLHRATALLHETESRGEIIFANFKGDETFSYLNGLPRYFQYKDVFNALDIVYGKLCARLSGEDTSENPVTFIFDEYVSAVLSQQAEEKKASTQTMSRIAEILLMGRACGRASVRFWCFTQRCDSAVFSHGSRESFNTVITLGNISKELKSMVFSDFSEDFENGKRFERGEGRILQNGAHLSHIKIPRYDIEAVKKSCITALSKPL
jgi:energy-coupling factor transporter ATP-binding protein EcfA2